MTTEEALGMLVFLAIFESLGGAAVGAGLRGLVERPVNSLGVFFLIWGSGFGGIPLVVGAAGFFTSNQPTFFFAQVFVFAMAILIAALAPRDLFAQGSENYGAALTGGVLVLFGLALVLYSTRAGFIPGWLFGAALGGLGVVLLGRALLHVLRAH